MYIDNFCNGELYGRTVPCFTLKLRLEKHYKFQYTSVKLTLYKWNVLIFGYISYL